MLAAGGALAIGAQMALEGRSPRPPQPSRSSPALALAEALAPSIAASPRSGGCATRRRGLPRRSRRSPTGKPDPSETAAPGLSLRGVTVAAPGSATALIQPVDLHVAPGEMVALTGRSGLGKSTLLHAIAGLSQPLSGTITLDGSAPWTCPRACCAPGWAYLPQVSRLVSGTIRSNLRLAAPEAGTEDQMQAF
jgi:ATP-binding cassette subfamily C protein CydC